MRNKARFLRSRQVLSPRSEQRVSSPLTRLKPRSTVAEVTEHPPMEPQFLLAFTLLAGLLILFFFFRGTKETDPPKPKKDEKKPTKHPFVESDKLPPSKATEFGRTTLLEVHKKVPLSLPPKLVLVTDLDHTLFGVGDEETHEEVENNLRV